VAISREVLQDLLKEYEKPEDLLRENGIPKEPTKAWVEQEAGSQRTRPPRIAGAVRARPFKPQNRHPLVRAIRIRGTIRQGAHSEQKNPTEEVWATGARENLTIAILSISRRRNRRFGGRPGGL
jgi:hypothetical protein